MLWICNLIQMNKSVLLPIKSYWSTQTSYGDHVCAFAIHTKRSNVQNYDDKIYGPWATTPLTTGVHQRNSTQFQQHLNNFWKLTAPSVAEEKYS